MSAPKPVHYVKHGNLEDALAHGLTVKAHCGLVWVPETRNLKGLPICIKCQALCAKGPDAPHFVYRCFDADDELLYVGVTNSLTTRRLNHANNSWWFPQMSRSRHIVYPTRMDALRMERKAIRREQPLWNVRHQDYKAWTDERVNLAREKALAFEAPAPVAGRFIGLAGVR